MKPKTIGSNCAFFLLNLACDPFPLVGFLFAESSKEAAFQE